MKKRRFLQLKFTVEGMQSENKTKTLIYQFQIIQNKKCHKIHIYNRPAMKRSTSSPTDIRTI